MEEKISSQRENVLNAYRKASEEQKALLESMFGKEMFQPKNIMERVKTFEDAEIREESQDAPAINIEELRDILSEIQKYQIGGSLDYESQIKRAASFDTVAADIAIDYLHKAEKEFLEDK